MVSLTVIKLSSFILAARSKFIVSLNNWCLAAQLERAMHSIFSAILTDAHTPRGIAFRVLKKVINIYVIIVIDKKIQSHEKYVK